MSNPSATALPSRLRLGSSRAWPPATPKRVAYDRAEVIIAAIALWLRDSQDTP